MCGLDSDAGDEEPRPQSVLGRLTDQRPRLSGAIGLTFWISAVATLILWANHTAPQSLTGFMFTESWLVGGGSMGAPVLMFTMLGKRLSVRALELIAAAAFTGAAIVTAFVAAGRASMQPWTAVFTLILLLAMGIDAANGAYGLDRRALIARRVREEERQRTALLLAEAKRERDAAVEDAFLAGIIKSFEAQHARTAELSSVLASDTEDLSTACAILREELNGRHVRHAVNGHNGTAKILKLVAGNQDPDAATGADPD